MKPVAARKTAKSEIFDILEQRFGSDGFRYTDILIAALTVRGLIYGPSDYDTSFRGFYAGSITDTTGYMYKPSKNDSRFLVKTSTGYNLSK
jgi:hypothetical protein